LQYNDFLRMPSILFSASNGDGVHLSYVGGFSGS